MAVIFLPCGGGRDSSRSLSGLLNNTPPTTAIFVPGDGEAQDLRAGLGDAERERVKPIGADGWPPGRMFNAVAAEATDSDLIVIAENVVLTAGALDRLGAAVHSDDTVAGATTLVEPEAAAAGGSAGRPDGPAAADTPAQPGAPAPSHPRLITLWPHCAWVRRSALQLVGEFDESLAHAGAVLADFAARALAHGLACVLADDVVLTRPAGATPWPDRDREQLGARYPWLAAARDEQDAAWSPVQRAMVAARAGQSRISVTIDARTLSNRLDGTRTYVFGLSTALGQAPGVDVRVVVADDTPAEVTSALTARGVDFVTSEQVLAGVPRSDVVHRPQQVFTPDDLRFLHGLGERIVISQMDLIAYRNPTYHPSTEVWRDYRRTTRMALASADQVIFFSEHTRGEATAEELIGPGRSVVVANGIQPAAGEDGQRPAAVPAGRRLLLVLGADYAHKNRPFALALFDQLRRAHGFDGLLVLAGPHQPYGSSAAAEREWLADNPEPAEHVLDLGVVSEAEKQWLMTAADALIYASNYEGFGLVPLEAAAAGRPCLYAACTSLAEIIDPAAAAIVPWDAAASAPAAAPLLQAGPARDRHMALLTDALESYRWEKVVPGLIDAYRRAISSPYRAAAPLAREAFVQEAERRALQGRVAYGQRLIDRQGGLLSRAQQRGLLRVASRPWLRGALLAPFGILGADQREGE